MNWTWRIIYFHSCLWHLEIFLKFGQLLLLVVWSCRWGFYYHMKLSWVNFLLRF
jgi:hypothetical protein